jgi:hypothetical protein
LAPHQQRHRHRDQAVEDHQDVVVGAKRSGQDVDVQQITGTLVETDQLVDRQIRHDDGEECPHKRVLGASTWDVQNAATARTAAVNNIPEDSNVIDHVRIGNCPRSDSTAPTGSIRQ